MKVFPLTPAAQLRARLVGICGAAGLVARLTLPSPPERSVEGVATMLGDAVGGIVAPGEFVWEASGGVLEEALFGRRVLFLAAAAPGEPRDVYRARVRVSLEGHPVAVGHTYDLSATPLGDENTLTADGAAATRYAAFASSSYDAVAAVTLLDLEGDGGVVGATGAIERWQGAMSNWLETGSMSGVGRVEFSFEHPAKSAHLSFAGGRFVIAPAGGKPAAYDLEGRALLAKDDAPVLAQSVPHLRKPPVLWAVDTVRSVVGPGPIAWLEDHFFGARDTVRRARYAAFGDGAETASPSSPDGAPVAPPAPAFDASAAGDDGGYWPPPALPTIWKTPDPGEGAWEPASPPFLKRLPGAVGEPPAYFYKTFVRPDAQRPYAKVLVLAMDTRQLELDMEGGVEDPKPATGQASKGRIPRDPAVLSRVVGAFNGAFKTEHGAYGMMVDKRILLPPKTGAATAIITDDYRIGLGTWRAGDRVPNDMLSFRQNLEALVDKGVVNPTGRTVWGFQIAGTSILTERTGLCVTKPGHLLYFWGDDVSGPTLGKAMVQAGCAYGMHLDMNPQHTGFVFTNVRDVTKKDYDVKLLSSQMSIRPDRYLEWSPKDFFYVMLRPLGAPTAGAGAVAWSPDRGTQPAPAWLPAIYEAVATGGETQVKLLAIDQSRVVWRVRAGRDGGEGASEGLARELGDDERHRVLAAIGLGASRSARPFGLTIEQKHGVPFRGQQGYLAVDAAGRVTIGAGEAPAAVDAAELPLVVSGGTPTPTADERGPLRRRVAACTLGDYVVFASATAESDASLGAALAKLSCTQAVVFDRGAHSESSVQRGESGGSGRAEHASLFAVASPLRPRAFQWDPDAPAADARTARPSASTASPATPSTQQGD